MLHLIERRAALPHEVQNLLQMSMEHAQTWKALAMCCVIHVWYTTPIYPINLASFPEKCDNMRMIWNFCVSPLRWGLWDFGFWDVVGGSAQWSIPRLHPGNFDMTRTSDAVESANSFSNVRPPAVFRNVDLKQATILVA